MWRDQIIAGEVSGIRDLARIHKLNHSYVKRIYSFASLLILKQHALGKLHDRIVHRRLWARRSGQMNDNRRNDDQSQCD
jgi:hypothetical protein